MSDYLTTKEVADLLRLRERKIYDLAARGEIPCMKATGKLLFPRDELTRWMSARGGSSSSTGHLPEVVLGSHDPVLEWAIGASQCGLPVLLGGSLDGLARFERNEGAICGVHIPNQLNEDWNLEVVTDRFADRRVVLMHWSRRERGLIVRPTVELAHFSQLMQTRFVKRQADSGAQHILEKQLATAGLTMDSVNCVREARTETEAALALVEGQADVTFGLRCFADRYGLKFVPVCTESFDLLIDRHAYCEPAFQTLLAFTRTEIFAAEVARYEGYDVSALGVIRLNGSV